MNHVVSVAHQMAWLSMMMTTLFALFVTHGRQEILLPPNHN